MPRRLATLASLLGVLLLTGLVLLRAAPASAQSTFSHALFGKVLATYVNAQGLIDYKGIMAAPQDLDAYLAQLAANSPASNAAMFPTKNDKLAYWVNAYNALAIKGVTNRPGLKSVDNVKVDYFALTKWTLGGNKISLYTLENDVVRKQFNDPRIHFALNCQSGGCPRLPQEAFEASRLDAQLDAATREFCTNPKKVYVDSEGVAHVSQIFEWYDKDFAAAGGAAAYVNKYGGKIPAGAKVTFIPYDWSLTAQPGRNP